MHNDICFEKILKSELILSCGCTEPAAVAFAAAKARETLGKTPDKIIVLCSKNFIKNALSVFIPNAKGLRGITAAAVLGMQVGTTKHGFELFSKVTEDMLDDCKKMLSTPDFCTLKSLDTPHKVQIIIEYSSGNDNVSVEIRDKHTNIFSVTKNGKRTAIDSAAETFADIEFCYERLSFPAIMDFIETADLAPFLDLLEMQIEMNNNIAIEGLNGNYGIKLHEYFLGKPHTSTEDLILALTTAASEARMSGCDMPVVINSGSGNQGITISVPLITAAKEENIPRERLYRAILLANLLNIYQKRFIGELSAYCGVASAACSVAGALTYLRGGERDKISMALRNHIAGVSGMICDGAKNTCAMKIAIALSGAFAASDRALHGKTYCANEGILKPDIDTTIKSLGKIASIGMQPTDDTILEVLLDQQ